MASMRVAPGPSHAQADASSAGRLRKDPRWGGKHARPAQDREHAGGGKLKTAADMSHRRWVALTEYNGRL
jgi:hypothetical protein